MFYSIFLRKLKVLWLSYSDYQCFAHKIHSYRLEGISSKIRKKITHLSFAEFTSSVQRIRFGMATLKHKDFVITVTYTCICIYMSNCL